jgi:exodeoxyribonuclease VII small subunit
MAAKAKQQRFETALADLETIVKELEAGDLPLDQALKRYEDGIKLVRYCNRTLDEAEKRVTLLTADADGNPVEAPFDGDV